jgi:protein TonB
MKGLLTALTILLSSLVAIGQSCTVTLVIKSDTIFVDPDKAAHPEEGHELYFGWISNHMNQKLVSNDEKLKKQVFVSFVVDEHGQLSNVKVEKGVGNPYDREAIRLIRKHPYKWIPGQCRDKYVKSKVVWFVKF